MRRGTLVFFAWLAVVIGSGFALDCIHGTPPPIPPEPDPTAVPFPMRAHDGGAG